MTGVKSPVRFNGHDCYGRFNIKLGTDNYLEIDIHALHTVMLYYDGYNFRPWLSVGRLKDTNIEKECSDFVKLIRMARLHQEQFEENYEYFESLNETLRHYSIPIFFDNICYDFVEERDMPALSGQKPRHIRSECTWSLITLPLLITRKKLPQKPTDDLIDIARSWGFVSINDSGQGFEGCIKNQDCIAID